MGCITDILILIQLYKGAMKIMTIKKKSILKTTMLITFILTVNSDEKEVFNLINKQRTNNGLAALKVDEEVQRIARIKAEGMVTNNYFSHQSPIYGSPFDMLRSFKIS